MVALAINALREKERNIMLENMIMIAKDWVLKNLSPSLVTD